MGTPISQRRIPRRMINFPFVVEAELLQLALLFNERKR
jgi:hypothetical protein